MRTRHWPDDATEAYEKLEQQLATKDAEIARLKTVPMRYRRMAFNAQLQNENEQLCQQLAESKKQNVLMQNSLRNIQAIAESSIKTHGYDRHHMQNISTCKEALDATQDLSDCILCDAEPAARLIPVCLPVNDVPRVWARTYTEYSAESSKKNLYRIGDEEPLYKAKGIKNETL